MGASSVAKGKGSERDVARRVRDKLSVDARRGQQRRRGDDEPDVVGLPAPWRNEVKYGVDSKLSGTLERGWTKLLEELRHGERPVLIHRQQRMAWRATVLLDDYLDLLRDLEDLRGDLAVALAMANRQQRGEVGNGEG